MGSACCPVHNETKSPETNVSIFSQEDEPIPLDNKEKQSQLLMINLKKEVQLSNHRKPILEKLSKIKNKKK